MPRPCFGWIERLCRETHVDISHDGFSDPRFERDGLRHVTFKSQALGARADLTVYVPDSSKLSVNRVPWVTLLHGVYGSHWAWAAERRRPSDRGAADRGWRDSSDGAGDAIRRLWGDGSGYVRHRAPRSRGDYERTSSTSSGAVAEVTPGVTAESPRFITACRWRIRALRIGAKHGRKFRAIAGHSSITEFSQMKQFVEEPLEAYGAIPAEEQSVFATILAHRDHLPPIRFDCGSEDQLIDANRTLHRELLARGVPHEYVESPGAHEWPYWNGNSRRRCGGSRGSWRSSVRSRDKITGGTPVLRDLPPLECER